jgi:hypothetical protein
MVVLLTYGLCPRKKPVSHLTSAARLACSVNMDRCNLSTSGRAPQVLGLVFGVSCGT